MTLPNFLIIGAAKAGTTSLFYALDQHPQVFMCPVKEAGFFWSYGEKPSLQGPGSSKLINRLVNDQPRYERLFRKVRVEKAIGEASVRYLSNPRSPELIHRFIPHARLIASLRQPAERAFSAFMHSQRDGVEPSQTFAEAIQQEFNGERDSWLFNRYLRGGNYYACLQRYLEFFDRSQMHISLLEDLKDNGPDLLSDIYRFLEVDDSFIPDLSHSHNESGVIRNPLRRLLWTHTNRLRAAVRPLFTDRFRHFAAEWFIHDLEKSKCPPDVYNRLTEYYRPDIEKLQEFLERDLSGWLKLK